MKWSLYEVLLEDRETLIILYDVLTGLAIVQFLYHKMRQQVRMYFIIPLKIVVRIRSQETGSLQPPQETEVLLSLLG